MDAVHKRSEEDSSLSTPPRREDITDTMIFSPSDLVMMICRDVDLNFATRGTITYLYRMGVGQYRKKRVQDLHMLFVHLDRKTNFQVVY